MGRRDQKMIVKGLGKIDKRALYYAKAHWITVALA
jgi:hypothetical protein